MLLAFLEHVQLLTEHEDRVLGRIFPLLSGGSAEPGPHFDKGVLAGTGCDRGVDVVGWLC